jgi:hypothetical protein
MATITKQKGTKTYTLSLLLTGKTNSHVNKFITSLVFNDFNSRACITARNWESDYEDYVN